MFQSRVLICVLGFSLLFAALICPPMDASIIGKTVVHLECSESNRDPLPKTITMMQAVIDTSFDSAPYVGIEMFASYPFRIDVDSGKVVAKGVVFKSDGRRIQLPRLADRMQFGDVLKIKSTKVVIEQGDLIEWTIKLKGLAPLEGFADCFTVEVGILCSETLPITSSLALSSTALSRKK